MADGKDEAGMEERPEAVVAEDEDANSDGAEDQQQPQEEEEVRSPVMQIYFV